MISYAGTDGWVGGGRKDARAMKEEDGNEELSDGQRLVPYMQQVRATIRVPRINISRVVKGVLSTKKTRYLT